MWVRALVVALVVLLAVGLCAWIAHGISRAGGKGALGSAFRWGLTPFAVFLILLPVLAMHGLLRAVAGTTVLMLDLSSLAFFFGLVIGLWGEHFRYAGPEIMDRTIALNRPVKRVFSVLLLIGLLMLAPSMIACAAELILQDLTDFSMSVPSLEPAVSDFRSAYAPVGVCAAVLSAVSLSLSLCYDWTVGACIERALIKKAKATDPMARR